MRFKSALVGKKTQHPSPVVKKSRTLNGAVALTSSGHPIVDLFSQVGGSRGKDISAALKTCHAFDQSLTASLMLWARDCRGGAGERQLFRQYLSFLEKANSDLAVHIVRLGKIQEMGRWDDLLSFDTDDLKQAAYKQIANGLSDTNTVGLCAKWMPRQGRVARELANYFKLSPRNWRKRIVASTNVVEQSMCAKEWEKINFSHVPSVAAARYQKAFTRHVPDQYQAYKNALVKGDPKVKVNATTVYPYDIVRSVRFGDSTVAQAQWDALPDYLGTHGGILPIIDVSGSMESYVPGQTTITHMDVAVSLGLYIALKQKGAFNRVQMAFSSNSEIIHLRCKTLKTLISESRGQHWGMSTNIDAAFRNLITFGLKNKLSDDDMPRTILIISDMEFNSCGHMTQHEKFKKDFKDAGYTIPQVVFWNVNARAGNTQTKYNENGVALVSGFSPAIMRSVLSATKFDPISIMMETLGKEKYQI